MPRTYKVIGLRGGAMKLRVFMTVIATAATVVFASACGSSTAVASGGQKTQQRVYYAFTTAGRPAIRVTRTVRGSCFFGSGAIDRSDAWRCFSGRVVSDPCFSSGKAKGIVLCPAPSLPWKRSGVLKIKLTKPLPRKYGSKRRPGQSGTPWGIQTTSGLKCFMSTGATNVVSNRRANYRCLTGRQWLWGAPERKYNAWRIYIAPINARKLTRKVKIRIAWF